MTYLDGLSGERVELSAVELGRGAALTAGLLRDECLLSPGSRVAVLLPPHWRTAMILLGAWSVGMAVSFRPRATAGLPVLEPGADRPYDGVFVTPQRLDDWLEDLPDGVHRYVVGTGPEPLVDAAEHEQPLRWLLAPLFAGASVVLCADLDPARRDEIVTAEQITRVL
ncbi:TIGR03089 family protein [Micromonospora sp. NPDC000207]|uniref:TIGR03089 family protein n=1 Tax=Micromonospora sp. NPDC000207 TaxID=3154246 RepID=UPI0033202F40